MDFNIEKECGALGGLFQSIVHDMKNSTTIWEDFLNKAAKLHSALRATILAAGAFLEAFQKVADMATNTKGATREMGSALTRLCMRHRNIENKLKAFTNAIMDTLVIPMQERMEEWKKSVITLDKDRQKDYKKAKAEIKRASTDSIRLQKKAKKELQCTGSVVWNDMHNFTGKSDIQTRLDNALQDVNDKYHLLEEAEKNAVRTALIEERSRFCHFITCLKPVVDHEVGMLTEVTHLQDIIHSLCLQATDPHHLPPASEQVILDLKSSDVSTWKFQVPDHTNQSPPSSPSSLGSRKSSMCSISSIASSSSGSSKSHSPSHHFRHRATSQPPLAGTVRLASVSSQDSGFTSQDTLFLKPPTPPPQDFLRKKSERLYRKALRSSDGYLNSLQENSSGSSTDSNASTPSPSGYPGAPSSSVSTWSNWPDPPHNFHANNLPNLDRPHTISSAYERNHNRPALTSQTFEPPEHVVERSGHNTAPVSPSPYAVPCIIPQSKRDSLNLEGRPPIPQGPKPRGKPVAPPTVPDFSAMHIDQSKKTNVVPQPVYVNMNDLATMAVAKQRDLEERARLQRILQQQMQHHQQQLQLKEQQQEQGEQRTQGGPPRCARSVSVPAQPPNSLELAEAIKELEASTAALEIAYDEERSQRQSGSSGYGSSTPSAADESDSSAFGWSTWQHAGFEKIESLMYTAVPVPISGEMSAPSPTPRRIDPARKPPIQPKRPASAAGVPGTATIRRGSINRGPPPPVRRSSSMCGAMPVSVPIVPGMTASSPPPGPILYPSTGSTTPTPESTPSMKHRETDITHVDFEIGGDDDKDCDDKDATTPVNYVPESILGLDAEEIDKWPPPPPDFMLNAPDHDTSGSSRGSIGSISDSHSDIMQSLEAKFTVRPPVTGVVIQQRPTDFGAGREQNEPASPSTLNYYSNISSDDATPTGEPPTHILSQIKQGVKLRKASSNDRSAPKFS